MRQRGERIGRRFQVKKMIMQVDGFTEPWSIASSDLDSLSLETEPKSSRISIQFEIINTALTAHMRVLITVKLAHA